MIRSPSKYYFLSPTLNASINFTLGKHNPNNRDYLGILAETFVASTFFRLKNTISKPNGIFSPTGKGMADFIITDFERNNVAVEVGIGEKVELPRPFEDGDSQTKKLYFGILLPHCPSEF